jgi:glucose/arabinose dehydrogenase
MKFFAFIFFSILSTQFSTAQPTIALTQFATGFTKPLCIANAGDSRLFVAGQNGQIWIVDSLGNTKSKLFLDIDPIVGSVGNEQGLLGLTFSPNYKSDGYFFVNYTDNNGDTHIARFSVSSTNPDSAVVASEKLLLFIKQPFTNHNGGSMVFGPDGYLYFGLGDGGNTGSIADPNDNGQNKKQYLGKIHRIDPFNGNPYAIPSTNPFVADTNYRAETWSTGVRNPWRFSFDRLTGDMWIGDVGQKLWEEIDFQPAHSAGGQNYGWRCYEGNVTYNASNCGPASDYIFPVYVYPHISGSDCSVTGGYVYRGADEGDLYGRYLFADYCSGKFWSILPNGTGSWTSQVLNSISVYQYTSFGENNKGELFVTAITAGTILKVGTALCLPTAHILSADTVSECAPSSLLQAVTGKGFTYQWKLNGNDINGATSSSYLSTQNGDYSVSVTNPSACSNLSNKVHLTLNACTGINTISSSGSMKLYPNPANGFANLEFNLANECKATLSVFNSIGSEIFKEEKELPAGINTWLLPAKDLAKGFYFVRLNTSQGSFVKRFVIN